mgnify:CR=1 FL=1
MRLRIRPSRCAGRQRPRSRGLMAVVPAENAQTTRPSWKTIARLALRGADGERPVFLLKETIWMISRSGRSSRLPVQAQESTRSITCGAAILHRRHDLVGHAEQVAPSAATTPASTAALGMP